MSGYEVNFSAQDAGFTSTVNKVEGSMKSLDQNVKHTSQSVSTSFASMAKAGAGLAAGFGAIKAAWGLAQGTVGAFSDALNMGGELNDMSARTGIAIDQLT